MNKKTNTIDAWDFVNQHDEALSNFVISKAVYKMTGSLIKASVLSQIVYWSKDSKKTGEPRMKIQKEDKLWIAKTRDEWCEECGISKKQIERVLDVLEEDGYIERKVFRFNCIPTTHIRLNKDFYSKKYMSILGYKQTEEGAIIYDKPSENDNNNIQNNIQNEEIGNSQKGDFQNTRKGENHGNTQKGHFEIPERGKPLTKNTDIDLTENIKHWTSQATPPPTFIKNKLNTTSNIQNKDLLQNYDDAPTFDDRQDLVNRPRFLERWHIWIKASGYDPDHKKVKEFCSQLKNKSESDAGRTLGYAAFFREQDNKNYYAINNILEKITGSPITGIKENQMVFKIAKDISAFWNDHTSGSKRKPNTSRFFFPDPETIALAYSDYILENYSNWKELNVYALKLENKIWKDFINHLSTKYDHLNIFDKLN